MSRSMLLVTGIICLGLAVCLLVFVCLQRDVCLALIAVGLLLSAFGAFARWASHPSRVLPIRVEMWLRTENAGWALFYIATGLVMLSGVLGLSDHPPPVVYALLALSAALALFAALWIVVYHKPKEPDATPVNRAAENGEV